MEHFYQCAKCADYFCPHHSANPRRLGGINLRSIYNEVEEKEVQVSWRHWNGDVHRERFDGCVFCLLCARDDRILDAVQFLVVQDRYLCNKSKP